MFRCENKRVDALFMYLMKIRTGCTDESIASYFDVSRSTVQSRMKAIREILMNEFVPQNVGYTRTRDDLILHTSTLSKCLFTPRNLYAAIFIWDGTYIYVEKSHQHEFQKNSYSSHKKRNYIKPMMIVSTDGTIIGVVGPFKATDNDAKIATSILSSGHPLLDTFETGDVVILDRGFRDCVHEFQSRGYIVKTPACQPLGKQLTTLEANNSRLVTKVRYDVERINGMVKATFKIFGQVWVSLSIPHLMADLQIVAGSLNKYYIKPNEDKNKSEDIAQKMLARVHLENDLAKIVKSREFNNKNNYALLETHSIFPEMKIEDLIAIAFREYQIIQSKL